MTAVSPGRTRDLEQELVLLGLQTGDDGGGLAEMHKAA